MKRVLVTGASGFIGRHTLSGLLSRGYEVHAVFSNSLLHVDNIFSYPCNLLDTMQTSQLMKEIAPSHLLHLAWYTYPGKYWTSAQNIDWVQASLHLLQEFIQQGGKRVVMAGSCAEYDWKNGFCHEQETPLHPSTLYGVCKASLYQIFEAYTKQIGLSSAWGRLFFLYGPHEYPQRLVPSIIQPLLLKKIAPCSHGRQMRDFLQVEDAGDAFAALLDSQVQGAINIASGQPLTLKEVINKIAVRLEGEKYVHFDAIPSAKNDVPYLVADITRLLCELKWHPKYSLDEGLDATIAWWKQRTI